MTLVNSAQHIVCMDANLSDRTFNVIKDIRDGGWNEVPSKDLERYMDGSIFGDDLDKLVNTVVDHLVVNTLKKK
jgi:hypothetical protein